MARSRGLRLPADRVVLRQRHAADPDRGHARASRRARRLPGGGRRLDRVDPLGHRLPAARAGAGAARRALRRLQPGPTDLAVADGGRRSRRPCRHVRGGGAGRAADALDLAGLRLHRDHRCVPRAAASDRRHLRRAYPCAVVSRRRGGADRSWHAERRHRHLPGHSAVLPARLRCADPLSPARRQAGGGVMDQAIVISFILSVMTASTPLLLAATGELVTEKSGVLNLGVEGMMLVGAIVGFATTVHTGSSLLGVVAALFAGMAMSLIFAILTLTFLANQVATGLALTIFGTGLSALVGSSYVGTAVKPLPKIAFGLDALVYLSLIAVAGVAWFLRRSHRGLVLRAVGDSHDAAHAIGYPVILIRYAATLFGGAMSGLAGAYMSLAYSTSWAENMTAGRGWIALALVVFATWRPVWLLVGAYLFGGIMYGSLAIQAAGASLPIVVPSQLVSALPYLATIVVLVVISRDKVKIRLNAPACLGRPFHAAG